MHLNICVRDVLAGSDLSSLDTKPVRVQHGSVTFYQDVPFTVRNSCLCVSLPRTFTGKSKCKKDFFKTLTAFFFCRFLADTVSDGVRCQQ